MKKRALKTASCMSLSLQRGIVARQIKHYTPAIAGQALGAYKVQKISADLQKTVEDIIASIPEQPENQMRPLLIDHPAYAIPDTDTVATSLFLHSPPGLVGFIGEESDMWRVKERVDQLIQEYPEKAVDVCLTFVYATNPEAADLAFRGCELASVVVDDRFRVPGSSEGMTLIKSRIRNPQGLVLWGSFESEDPDVSENEEACF